MKNRISFVTNSSSSSFIVINKNVISPSVDIGRDLYLQAISSHPERYVYTNDEGLRLFVVGSLGQCDFGWQIQIYSSIIDKLNWCALMIAYKHLHIMDNEEYLLELDDDNQREETDIQAMFEEYAFLEHTFMDIYRNQYCVPRDIEPQFDGLIFTIPIGYACLGYENIEDIIYSHEEPSFNLLRENYGYADMYIDHQSRIEKNYIPAASSSDLYNFLESSTSYISCDNDNH